ncbi:MAG: hypothetical protein ACOY93_07755 [Bacillota bacterium]
MPLRAEGFGVSPTDRLARVGETESTAVGRIDLPLFREGDFGNLGERRFECEEPNRLCYRVENGYGDEMKVTEGVLLIPPR